MSMTETNERVTALETKMDYALDVLSKREDYQSSVLKSLTIIEMKQDQALNYQKTCDAERSAHGIRLNKVENEVEDQKSFGTALAEHGRRLQEVEAKFRVQGWLGKLIGKTFAFIGGATTFAVAAYTLFKMFHP
jgi:hypothetical protein